MRYSFLPVAAMISVSAAAQTVPATPPQSPGGGSPGMSYRYVVPVRPLRADPQRFIFSQSHFGLTRREMASQYQSAIKFANCTLGSADAERILSTNVGSREERQLIYRMQRNNVRCGGSAGGISSYLIRAALGEVFIRNLPSMGDGLFAETPARSNAVARIDGSVALAVRVALSLARCHVAAGKDAVHLVMATEPGSSEEGVAQAKLFKAAPACTGGVQPAELDTVAYRAMLVDALIATGAG